MKIDPNDNSYTDRSPCRGCKLDDIGVDKNLCLAKCLALAAYRDCGLWRGVPRLSLADVMVAKKTETVGIETIEIEPETAAPTDKTAAPKKDKSGAICIIPDCPNNVFCRKLCRYHYGQWHYGSLKHPDLGFFQLTYKKRLIPTCKSVSMSKVGQTPFSVNLDFRRYPQLYNALDERAKKSLLSVNHIVMDILSEAMGGSIYNK